MKELAMTARHVAAIVMLSAMFGAPAAAALFGTTAIASVDAPLASASAAAATQRVWSDAPADLLGRNS